MKLTIILLALFAATALATSPVELIKNQANAVAKSILQKTKGRRLEAEFKKLECENVKGAVMTDCTTAGGATAGVVFLTNTCIDSAPESSYLEVSNKTIVYMTFSKTGCKTADHLVNLTFTDGECLLSTMQFDLYNGKAITLYDSGTKADCSDTKKVAAIKDGYCMVTDEGSQKFKCDGTKITVTEYTDAACATEKSSDSHESGTCFDGNALDSAFKSIPLFITTVVVAFLSFALF